ncbi:MAG: hypothetical protein ACI8Z1_000512 [Candidatus Azotimanducaceae bacterium]
MCISIQATEPDTTKLVSTEFFTSIVTVPTDELAFANRNVEPVTNV